MQLYISPLWLESNRTVAGSVPGRGPMVAFFAIPPPPSTAV